MVSLQGGTRSIYTVYDGLNHIFYQFSSLTPTLGTVSLRHRVQCQEPMLIQDDDIKMNSRPSFPLLLPIHCLWHTYGHAGICSRQILNLTKNKLMLTRWVFEPMQTETQDWGRERSLQQIKVQLIKETVKEHPCLILLFCFFPPLKTLLLILNLNLFLFMLEIDNCKSAVKSQFCLMSTNNQILLLVAHRQKTMF